MSGRRFAYLGVVVGLVVSVAANVAHAAQSGNASWPALAMAGFWPLALFLALEILTRTQWTGGRGLAVARLGVGLVALVAAALSYWHLRGLLLIFGEMTWAATLGPLAVDGLMAVSASALLNVAPVEQPAAQPVADTGPAAEPVTVPAVVVQPETVREPVWEPAWEPIPSPAGPIEAAVLASAARHATPEQHDTNDLLLVGRAVAVELERAGKPLTRTALVAGLRERGHSIGTDRARNLLAALKAA